MSEFATGLIPRDYSEFPSGYLSCAPSAPDDWLVPENEWEERLKEQKARRSSLLHLREGYYDTLKSLNQTSHPLCWAFSTTKSVMYALARAGTPTVLSPWWTAGVSNGWRNTGGWGSQSTEGLAKTGGVPMAACPDFSSRYATTENKTLAAKRRVIEWFDGSQDRARNRHIMVSAFLLGLAPVNDYNDIGHSMCGCYLESINPLVWYDDNSWGGMEQYGPKGLYKRTRTPDGIIVPRWIQPAD